MHNNHPIVLSIILIGVILVPSIMETQQVSYAQTSNESDTIQCVAIPCELHISQPLPAEQNTTNTIVMPTDETQLSDELQSNDSQTEPCISPCPPGEVCIQMCQPIGPQNAPPAT